MYCPGQIQHTLQNFETVSYFIGCLIINVLV